MYFSQTAAVPEVVKNPVQAVAPAASAKHSDRRMPKVVEDRAKKLIEFLAATFDGKALSPDAGHLLRDLMESIPTWDAKEAERFLTLLAAKDNFNQVRFIPYYNMALIRLGELEPEKALGFFQKEPIHSAYADQQLFLLQRILSQWSSKQPMKAWDWYQMARDTLSDANRRVAQRQLLQDLSHADMEITLRLADDSIAISPFTVIAYELVKPEEQAAYLDAMRKRALADPQKGTKQLNEALGALFRQNARLGYEKGMAFLQSGQLSPAEVSVCLSRLEYEPFRRDVLRWMDWITADQSLDSKAAGIAAAKLQKEWTKEDYIEAGKWLNQAPEGPAKQAAVVSYIATVARYNWIAAGQWSETLPPEKKSASLQTILKQLVHSDPQAADEFARKYHLTIPPSNDDDQ